jgi:hypothetical protein
VFNTHLQDDPDDPAVYFTDRQYYRRPQQPSRTRQYTPSNRSYRPPQKTKKCFVCHKEGCWSSNHTQEERDKSRKKFENRINQYIVEYEGDEEQEIDKAIEALIIDNATD